MSATSELTLQSGSLTRLASDLGQVCQEVHLYSTFLSGLRQYPKWTEDWIINVLGVLCEGHFGHRVNNLVAHFLDVDPAENGIGRPGEGLCDSMPRR